jgi:hypothetical protein
MPIRIQNPSNSIAEGTSEVTKAVLQVADATLRSANETKATAVERKATGFGAGREATKGQFQRFKSFVGAISAAVDKVAIAGH